MSKTSRAFMTLLIFLSINQMSSQELQQTDSLLNKGKKAITFSFDGLYLRGGLGGTFWLNEDYALRVLINGSYSYERDLTANNRSSYSGAIGITSYLKRHFHINPTLSPYIGGGIGLNYHQSFYSYDSQTNRYGEISVPALLGVEFWLTNNISLSGEQIIKVELDLYRFSRDFSVSNSTSSLLLSVYF